MQKSYKTVLTVDADGRPTAMGTPDEQTLLGGLISYMLNFDQNTVFTGPVALLGRVADAALGAIAEHKLKNGYFTVPFIKVGQ